MSSVTGTDRDDVKVKGVDSGGTDREITAVQDGSTWRMAVDTAINAANPGNVGYLSNNLIYEDMNATTGGIARNTAVSTTWTDVYSYSGSGLLCGAIINMNGFPGVWEIRIIVDSGELFGSAGIKASDMSSTTIYNYGDSKDGEGSLGISRTGTTFRFSPKNPILYETSVVVKIRQSSGSKNFQAGLAVLTKET